MLTSPNRLDVSGLLDSGELIDALLGVISGDLEAHSRDVVAGQFGLSGPSVLKGVGNLVIACSDGCEVGVIHSVEVAASDKSVGHGQSVDVDVGDTLVRLDDDLVDLGVDQGIEILEVIVITETEVLANSSRRCTIRSYNGNGEKLSALGLGPSGQLDILNGDGLQIEGCICLSVSGEPDGSVDMDVGGLDALEG